MFLNYLASKMILLNILQNFCYLFEFSYFVLQVTVIPQNDTFLSILQEKSNFLKKMCCKILRNIYFSGARQKSNSK